MVRVRGRGQGSLFVAVVVVVVYSCGQGLLFIVVVRVRCLWSQSQSQLWFMVVVQVPEFIYGAAQDLSINSDGRQKTPVVTSIGAGGYVVVGINVNGRHSSWSLLRFVRSWSGLLILGFGVIRVLSQLYYLLKGPIVVRVHSVGYQ